MCQTETMARLVCVLFLLLLLGSTALTDSVPHVFVKEEHDEVLECDKVQDEQKHCNMTTWIYSNQKISKIANEFITLGKMSQEYKNKNRFSLTETCSLRIRNVEIQDHGHYTCIQYDQAEKQVSNTVLEVSVVSLTEHADITENKLNCYVSSSQPCSTIGVKLLYNGTEVENKDPSSLVSSYGCGFSVSFRPEYFSTLRKELFLCEITHKGEKHPFKLKDQPTEPEKPGINPTQSTNDTREGQTSSALSDWWWIVLVAVAAAALIITAVVLVKRRNKKEKPQEDDTQQPVSLTTETEPEDGVSYASITYTKKKKPKPEPKLSEEDTVTYSAVRTPASLDVDCLYASVKK